MMEVVHPEDHAPPSGFALDALTPEESGEQLRRILYAEAAGEWSLSDFEVFAGRVVPALLAALPAQPLEAALLKHCLSRISEATAIPAEKRSDLDFLRSAVCLAHAYARAALVP